MNGIDGQFIEVEIDVSNGLPQITIVGLPDNAIRESSERVRTAIRNCGFEFPLARITVNLAPADMRKEGAAFDLAIAAGVLFGSGQLESAPYRDTVMIGELALDGTVKPVNGILSMVHAAKMEGYQRIIVPEGNLREAQLIDGLIIMGVHHLGQLKNSENLFNDNNNKRDKSKENHSDQQSTMMSNYGDVHGQQQAKRTMMIAAAGMHNVLLIGPPGSGKTMLLRRLPSIMPPLADEEALEVMKIYSVAGLYRTGCGLWRERPFRSPHHTISYAGMLGGGNIPKPGEVSLSHRGVLFLDELPEFHRQVLEVLRQPMEDRFVTIARARATMRYPTSFLLAASMNPCPCGYSGISTTSDRCPCTPRMISRYRAKLSGPLLDRIDMHTEVPKANFQDLALRSTSMSHTPLNSETMRMQVLAAQERQQVRYKGLPFHFNSELFGGYLQRYCTIPKESMLLLSQTFETLGLSARALDRIIKIARTIADLEACDHIQNYHIAEAIQYRILDRAE